MNIGIRLHDTAGTTLEEHLRSARDQGFSCIHLALQKTVPGFAMNRAPELLTDALADEVGNLLAKYGLSCAVLGCYLNLATPDMEAYEHTLDIYRAHLRFAKKMDALCVGTETGAPNTGYKTEPACWTEESLALFIDRLTPVVRFAEEVGKPIAIEPVCRHIVSTPARTKAVLDALPSDALQIILDAVNLLTPENYPQQDAIVAESLRLFADKILLLHLKDFTVGENMKDLMPYCCACGKGVMTYDRLLRFAKENNLPITLEDTKPDNAEGARLFLEETAARL